MIQLKVGIKVKNKIDDIKVTEREVGDECEITITMPTKKYKQVQTNLAAVGLSPETWLKAILIELTKTGLEGPAGRFVNDAIHNK